MTKILNLLHTLWDDLLAYISCSLLLVSNKISTYFCYAVAIIKRGIKKDKRTLSHDKCSTITMD